MQDLPVHIANAGFSVMGIGAIAKPAFVTAQFGTLDLTRTGRNQVRAVYGGFCVFRAPALLVARRQAELRDGILVAVAAALGGMTAGRLVSAPVGHGLRAPDVRGDATAGRSCAGHEAWRVTVPRRAPTAPLNQRTARSRLNQPRGKP